MSLLTRNAQSVGFLPSGPGGLTATLALSAAATRLAYSFVPGEAQTLSEVRAFLSAASGTLAAADVTCALFADGGAGPTGAALQTVGCAATPAVGWGTWSGFSTALTAGVMYWLVFANANGTPASNFPTFRFGQANTAPLGLVGSGVNYGWHKRQSADSGSTWTTSPVASSSGWRVGYAGGAYDGLPASNIAAATGAAADVYGTREVGVRFTTPPGATLNLRGAVFYAEKSGSPAGGLVCRLYQGAALLASTSAIPAANVGTGFTYLSAAFTSSQPLAPGTLYRVTLADTNAADTSANVFRTLAYTWDTDANSLALLPFEGTAKQTYFDGSSWTDTNALLPFGLLLDPAGEFTAAGGLFSGTDWAGGYE